MTNYEEIKTMSIEEMADKFEMREFFALAFNGTYTEKHRPALEWLASDVEENGKLKSCPLCGGEAKLFNENFGKKIWIQCTECGLQTDRYSKDDFIDGKDGESWAVFHWNNRRDNK